jgi:glycolate oxidase
VTDLVEQLRDALGADAVTEGDAIRVDDTHDEALTAVPVVPLAVVRPRSSGEVAAVLRCCNGAGVPVVARGSGTGLSGGCLPDAEGVVVAFDAMTAVKEIDSVNHVAVVEPGVTLAQLDAALAPHGLVYPVFPGELSASIGGNVGTNAGGMRAIRYGVTRHHVLGIEAVLATGEVIRCGGLYVKSSSGYDLTQLVVGSEGTLALVTEATLKLHPRLAHTATVLAPFDALETVTRAVPVLLESGATPQILEYLDMLTMASITAAAGIDLAIPAAVREAALAYLVVVLESADEDRLGEDVVALCGHLESLGALDVYVLPPTAGAQLIEARERAFFVAKASGADDIIDVVVPRAAIPAFLARTGELAAAAGALMPGCGHVGDGNVHLSVFLPDAERRRTLLHEIFAAGVELGGAVSGEHGIGTEKRPYLLEFEDPVKIDLMRRIKAAFDPNGILGPGRIFGAPLRPAVAAAPGPGGPR